MPQDPGDPIGSRLPPRVLVVEDGLLNRQLARTLLERADFRVEVAENGAEAVDVCEREAAFDLILMDLDMPVMDGFEAAAAIRRLKTNRGGHVPIVALSALTDPVSVARARSVGMDGHLAKPYDPRHFVQSVRRVLTPPAAIASGRSGKPVWNRAPYDDFVRRLGAARMATHIELFGAKLRRIRAALTEDPADHGHLTWEAHALVSSAGALGFEELGELSARAQKLSEQTDVRPVSLELVAAIDRVLAQLPSALP